MTKELVDKITMLEFKQELKEHLNNVTEVLNEAKEEIIRLTKENVELKDKLNNLASVAEVRLANWQKYEKENVELKDTIKEYSKALNQRGQSAWFYKEKAEKLSEAKDIIRALLFHLNKDTFAVIYETQKESIERAEQFLKENE